MEFLELSTLKLKIFRIKAYIKILSTENLKGECKKKIWTKSDVAPLLNNFFKMNPKIGICKNEKIDFFARECKYIPTFSILDKLVSGQGL